MVELIIKCEDFIVNEIDTNRNIVELTSTEMPSPSFFPTVSQSDSNSVSADPAIMKPLTDFLSEDLIKQIKEYVASPMNKEFIVNSVPKDKMERMCCINQIIKLNPLVQVTTAQDPPSSGNYILKLYKNPNFIPLEKYLSKDDIIKMANYIHGGIDSFVDRDSLEPVTTDIIEDKDNRREIHIIIKQKFKFLLSSTTEDKRIKIVHKEKSKKRKRQNSSSSSSFNILQCTLQKANIENYSALYKLSNIFQIPIDFITIAGTKDKKAITTQLITIKEMNYEKLMKFRCSDDIKLGDYKMVERQLNFGDLYGNHFKIRIKNISSSSSSNDSIPITKEMILKSLESLQLNGFINYFGSQRVGNPKYNIISSDIGKKLIQKNFKEAIELKLTPQVPDVFN